MTNLLEISEICSPMELSVYSKSEFKLSLLVVSISGYQNSIEVKILKYTCFRNLNIFMHLFIRYQNSPDLRLTWLYNMASKHGEV